MCLTGCFSDLLCCASDEDDDEEDDDFGASMEEIKTLIPNEDNLDQITNKKPSDQDSEIQLNQRIDRYDKISY